ncbi:MAG: tetratricopeptide repeat protein [Jaaginema sp. PMC 1079.18]|nr:tetratricopeptide repeat protein [Jaaginema sp. PMC 1080.18]MEC4853955.1 tetratricopeptide repeat protein [Jaaginema sp. PMC 1079.18]MEC4868507.1 tetratricopeptide repeat protein [Jaaginema sp. PMC 1078.18]
MSSLRDRYFELIDEITDLTLKGKISSKTQVYKKLVAGIEPGTGEIFERCLAERIESTKGQLAVKLKAARILRSLEMVQGEWGRWQKENQQRDRVTITVEQIQNSENGLLTVLQSLDPNQKQPFPFDQFTALATALEQHNQAEIARGITEGLQAFATLEPDLLSWLYASNSNLGFGGGDREVQPWALWSKKTDITVIQSFLAVLAQRRSPLDWMQSRSHLDVAAILALAVFFQGLQRSLVSWFDRQPYDAQIGKQLSNRTLLTFAALWGQLWNGLQQSSYSELTEASFQVTLQFLRLFARREDFPLYGGILISLGGESLQEALKYLDEPLGRWDITPEKGRLLTLLGYSQHVLGRDKPAVSFHEQALEIARETQDRACEIANLNHISRIYATRKQYPEAVSYSQRALILAREVGDRLGTANALVNFGYSEVLAATQLERLDADSQDRAITYLQQGLEVSERLGDLKTLGLAHYSLGVAWVLRAIASPQTAGDRAQDALTHLIKALELSAKVGDIYLQGLTYRYLAEAYYSLSMLQNAVVCGSLAMYSLHQIEAVEWRQAAGLLLVLRGKWGEDASIEAWETGRSEIIKVIGVDGYDYLPQLLREYQQNDF